MKKTHLLRWPAITLLFLFILLLFITNCTKNAIKSPNDNSVSDNKPSNEIVKNFIPSDENDSKKSENEIPLSLISSSWPFSSNVTQLKISGCGGTFSRSYAGTGYYVYPQDTIDVSSMVEGSTINVNVSAYDVPNKFSIYDISGGLVASSSWMGYADYSGPWGQSLNTNPNGTLYFTKSSSSTYYFKVETSVNTISDSYDATVSCTAPSSITKTFAGVSIKFYPSTGLLQFNNATDFSKVLDSLDVRYETYNANYENQYPTLTPDQMDSVDAINNFDEFITFRQFEILFSGYSSKRAQIEGIENTWLANNFTGTDPDDIDPTYDDAENTVSNTSSKVIVGTVTYNLADSSSGGTTAFAMAAASAGGCNLSSNPPCFTNKRKRSPRLVTPDGLRSFISKVAIHAWCVRTGVKGKVVSFKNKNGNWKRARMQLAVSIAGSIYDNQCIFLPPNFNVPNPSTGYKKRKQLKVSRHAALETWKTQPGQLGSSFEAQNVATGGVSF